ncbi:MAG: helix-turn-helix domain-containing protein [Treponema sp.]|nr:helix-turn-helix domain-containing protein [Treponema sp.]
MDEQDLRRILSKNLRKYRNYRQFSQVELAEKLDISVPFLSDIENGKKWVSPRTLAKMADVFHIEAYELLKPEQSMPDNPVNIIEKYTADLYSILGKNLYALRDNYLSTLNK